MKLPRFMRIRRAVRARAWSLGAHRGAIILLYHRVATVRWDPWQLCVVPSNFAEHLEVLKRHATVLSLGELVSILRAGRLPRRVAVLTFDDGYADNLRHARPLLERYDVPATVFLTTGSIRRAREFWWDELEQLVLQAARLPAALCLNVDGHEHEWRWSQTGKPVCTALVAPSRLWRERAALLYWLHARLQPLTADRQERALEDLSRRLSVEPVVRPSHKILSPKEVVELADSGLVEIGAHSVTHPLLSQLHPQAQRQELEGSKAACEALLGRPVTSFAYPYGDYTAETAILARNTGFSCACACIPDIVDACTDPYLLPRLEPGNIDGDAFAKGLRRAFLN